MKLKTFLAATAILAVALTGCSDDSDSTADSAKTTTTEASGKAPVCEARSDLAESVKALADPSLLTGGKAGIESALDEVKSDLDALSSAAGDVYQPQVDDVKAAVDDVGTAVSGLGSGSVTENLQAVGNAIADVGTTSADLLSTVQKDCPSS